MSRLIKLRPSDAERIKKLAEEKGQTLSATVLKAIEDYGNGRAQKPKPKSELFNRRVHVFGPDTAFDRAFERARREERPIGEAIAEQLLTDED